MTQITHDFCHCCSGTKRSRSQWKRHVAHKLLIELLACQFAYPVRWIETQDDLFSREDVISRVIELGPAKILGNMAKQTIDGSYKERDQARCINRKFLSSETDAKDIKYEYDPPENSNSSPSNETGPSDSETNSDQTESQPAFVSPPSPPQQNGTATEVPDSPVSPLEIVQSLVARKLGKALDALDSTKSIKDLSGGKSTLQNELVGFLSEEFPSLPSGAEEMPLESLDQSLASNFSGRLGKQSAAAISKLVSSKMPAGFNQSAIGDYLKETWGLGPGRQSSVLLFVLASEPPSRTVSRDAAKELLDSLAKRYAKFSGIELGSKRQNGGGQQSAGVVIDSGQIDSLRKDQREILSKNFNMLASQLQIDPSKSKELDELQIFKQEYESRLEMWNSEFDEDYESGIRPFFDPQKKRRFNSWWNLVRQDVIRLQYELENGLNPISAENLDELLSTISCRYTESLKVMIERITNHAWKNQGLANPMLSSVGKKLSARLALCKHQPPMFIFNEAMTEPRTAVSHDGTIKYTEEPRRLVNARSYPDLLMAGALHNGSSRGPFAQIKTQRQGQWYCDTEKTGMLLHSLHTGMKAGLTFSRKNVLLTGAGPGSIGSEVLCGLLKGGARVIVTTSKPPAETANFYQSIYADCGSRGSELVILPFNQGNKKDCEGLIDHIYSDSGLKRTLDIVIPFAAVPDGSEIDGIDAKSELAHRVMLTNVLRLLGQIIHNKSERRIDTRPTQVLLPLSPNHGMFGGDGLYSESKLGLESLLNRFKSESWSNYLSVCGAVIGWTRGTGLMSNNNIIAQSIEAKNCLTFSQKEMAFNLLTLIAGPLSETCEIEPILAYVDGGLHLVPDLKELLANTRAQINHESKTWAAIKEEDKREQEALSVSRQQEPAQYSNHLSKPRSTLRIGFPALPDYEKDVKPLSGLRGMVDPSRVPVIVGFSELGPWGSARTRWEMESRGELSQEGFIEMAWTMNLIKHVEKVQSNGEIYAGWVDSKTEEQVHDSEVPEKYSKYIMEHSGIRFVEPDLFKGYDPERKEYMHEVLVEEDLPEFDASGDTAEAFRLRHRDKVGIRHVDGDSFKVQLKHGAIMMVPKAVPFEGIVAGQLPSGFDPSSYGIPEDIVRQVDPVTLYALCCVSEALYSAGISDSFEIFKHIHVSEVGNFIGSMMGGITKTRNMYRDQYLDHDVQGDVMQETYLSTTAAWVNMLLLGTAGPIKTPTGACATGVESVDSACESLISGKTKLCFAGGTDDYQEEESYCFRSMNATANARDELAKGRLPHEMSRPTSDTRSGFVESQGSGVQVMTSAKVALDLGLPIYGIIAGSTMAGDKISRSVPAPGQGVLSYARESPRSVLSPLTNLDYRRSQLELAISGIQRWRDQSLQQLEHAYAPDQSEYLLATAKDSVNESAEAKILDATRNWGNDLRQQDPSISPLRSALAVWGLTIDDIDFASLHATSTKANDKNEPEIINKQMSHLGRNPAKPLLAVCQKSLTGHPKAPAASFMLNGGLQALNAGLVPGNRNADNVDESLSSYEHMVFPTRSIQASRLKAFSVTSFGFGQKGGQIIGVHPRYLYATLGRQQYDDYCVRLSSRTRKANQAFIRAMIHNRIVEPKSAPPYDASNETPVVLDPASRIAETKDAFKFEPRPREDLVGTSDTSNNDSGKPIDLSMEPSSRKDSGISLATSISKSWLESAVSSTSYGSTPSHQDTGGMNTPLNPKSENVSVGIDVETPAVFASREPIFYDRNYTLSEREYADTSPDPKATFAGRWTAKEAVFKSLGVQQNEGKGAGAAMKDIEILSGNGNRGGPPVVELHNDALAAAHRKGIKDIKVSLSHADETVMAVALAVRNEKLNSRLQEVAC